MSKRVNFIEASESGKRFRIVNDCNNFKGPWWKWTAHTLYSMHSGKLEVTKLMLTEVYEIEEQEVTITESTFDGYTKHLREASPMPQDEYAGRLKSLMGFK